MGRQEPSVPKIDVTFKKKGGRVIRSWGKERGESQLNYYTSGKEGGKKRGAPLILKAGRLFRSVFTTKGKNGRKDT